MQSRPVCPLRKDHLVRLRHARRRRHGQRPAGAAVHLPLTRRRLHARSAKLATPTAQPAPATVVRAALLAMVRVRERTALDHLGAAVVGRSLCAPSRAGTSLPAAKYHEGSAAALAEVRRTVQRAGGGPDGAIAAGVLLRDIRASWLAQVGTAGRTGPGWAGYLAGGLDALAQLEPLVDDDEGRGARDLQD